MPGLVATLGELGTTGGLGLINVALSLLSAEVDVRALAALARGSAGSKPEGSKSFLRGTKGTSDATGMLDGGGQIGAAKGVRT